MLRSPAKSSPSTPRRPRTPAIVNSEPYGKGWLFKIAASAPRESDVLMNAGDYEKFLSTEAAHGSH